MHLNPLIKNPPIYGNFSKQFKEDWKKYYDKAYIFYKDKERAAETAWTIAKRKYKKSAKTGKWVLKRTESKTVKLAKGTKKLYKKTKRKTKRIYKAIRN